MINAPIVLNCCVWVKFLNPLTQIIKSFLCKRCECIEVLAIKILSKDNVVHPYAVIVVLTHAITQNPKIAQVYPVCRFVLDSAEQHSSCVEVVSAMVVVMQHKLPLIVYVEVFVFFVFLGIAVEERNVFQTVPIDVISWFHVYCLSLIFPFNEFIIYPFGFFFSLDFPLRMESSSIMSSSFCATLKRSILFLISWSVNSRSCLR
jgi:hypothetical protein